MKPFSVAKVIYITAKFETTGSNFSHETCIARLLAALQHSRKVSSIHSLIRKKQAHRQILLVNQMQHQIKSLILNEQGGRKLNI